MGFSTKYWVSPRTDEQENVERCIDIYDPEMEECLGTIKIVEGEEEFVAIVGREDMSTKRIFCTIDSESDIKEKVSEIANKLANC